MDTILAITYSFLLSFMPLHNVSLEKYGNSYKNATHVKFEFGLDFKDTIRIYGGEETYQVPYPDIFNCYPYRQTYQLGIEFHKEFNDSFNVKFGVNHSCTHPVNCWYTVLCNTNEGVSAEIYIDISGKVKVF